ncbi:MAG: hypothetical protein ACK5PP_00860 [Acidimicrobiales bacterium]
MPVAGSSCGPIDPPRRRSRPRPARPRLGASVIAVGLVAAGVFAGAGCAADGTVTTTDHTEFERGDDPVITGTSPSVPPTSPVMDTLATVIDSGLLAVVIAVGGRCESGVCERPLDLAADGAWTLIEGGEERSRGTYDVSQLRTDALALEPGTLSLGTFAGECPTAYDGQERFYRIYDPAEVGVVAADVSTCIDQVDTEAPIIITLDFMMADALRATTADE